MEGASIFKPPHRLPSTITRTTESGAEASGEWSVPRMNPSTYAPGHEVLRRGRDHPVLLGKEKP
jgi:hypothetical protein